MEAFVRKNICASSQHDSQNHAGYYGICEEAAVPNNLPFLGLSPSESINNSPKIHFVFQSPNSFQKWFSSTPKAFTGLTNYLTTSNYNQVLLYPSLLEELSNLKRDLTVGRGATKLIKASGKFEFMNMKI